MFLYRPIAASALFSDRTTVASIFYLYFLHCLTSTMQFVLFNTRLQMRHVEFRALMAWIKKHLAMSPYIIFH